MEGVPLKQEKENDDDDDDDAHKSLAENIV